MVIDALTEPAVRWLAATGAPNWLVLVAVLTTPVYWSRKVRELVGNAYQQYVG